MSSSLSFVTSVLNPVFCYACEIYSNSLSWHSIYIFSISSNVLFLSSIWILKHFIWLYDSYFILRRVQYPALYQKSAVVKFSLAFGMQSYLCADSCFIIVSVCIYSGICSVSILAFLLLFIINLCTLISSGALTFIFTCSFLPVTRQFPLQRSYILDVALRCTTLMQR